MRTKEKYEPFASVEWTLCERAMFEALAKCGFAPPALAVSRDQTQVGLAVLLQRAHNVNIIVDPDLEGSEWYVEWNSKRFGSKGC